MFFLVPNNLGVLTKCLTIGGSEYASGNIDAFRQSGAVGCSKVPRVGEGIGSVGGGKVGL